MSQPTRVHLRRTKGWRKPEGAIVVARPSKWGNPYSVAGARDANYQGDDEGLRAMCVAQFRSDLRLARSEPYGWSLPIQIRVIAESIDELRGHDLACWCPLDQPCHADVLLEIANAS